MHAQEKPNEDVKLCEACEVGAQVATIKGEGTSLWKRSNRGTAQAPENPGKRLDGAGAQQQPWQLQERLNSVKENLLFLKPKEI